jgi:hypothetical protein
MSKAAELAALIGSGQAQENKNLLINSAMRVAQRGTSSTAASYKTVDRFFYSSANLDNHAFTQTQQAVTDLAGFTNSWRITTTTAESAIAADELVYVAQKIEAQNLQKLAYGTSSAKRVTLSFYVKSSVTGTFSTNLYQTDDSRIVNSEYTISSANTWERKEITYPADQTGVIDNNNGTGLYVTWILASGSNWKGNAATAWEVYSTNNWSGAGTYTDAVITTINSTWEITGVQLEIGDVATPFEHEDIGTTLAKCKRYFENVEFDNYVIFGNSYTTTQFVLPQIIWKVEKRTAPTLTFPTIGTSSGNVAITKDDGNYVTQGSVIRAFITTTGAAPYNNNADGYSGLTDDSICSLYSVGDSTLKVDAEL